MKTKASQVIFQALSISPATRARLAFSAEIKRQIDERTPKEPHILVGALEDAYQASRTSPHDTQAFESSLCLYRAAAHWYKSFAACPESLLIAAWSEVIANSLDKLQAALTYAISLQPKGDGLPYCEGRR